MKTSVLLGIIANSKTRVRCIFCGVYIPKANKCIEQHINGSKHKENIELMTENGISFNTDILYCKPCKSYLPDNESITKHIEGDAHANWVAAMDDLVDGEFISLNAYLSSDTEDVFCEVCKHNIHCTLPNIEEHVNSLSHRSHIVEKLKPLNGIFRVQNDDEVWCKVCDVYIDSNVLNILEHIDEDEHHMEWFMEIEDLMEGQDMSIVSYLANEFEKFAYCNKCNVEVICNSQNIEQHVNSESHLNQFS
ncbi:unnamed protein product [Parnassius apollo]|uniref:(apollo) hypothetical protein n=1 Tax=Parnassius apollo TaxID=110799 RepID=A0A8S3Y5G2_PARAO|nr:unnamed protein product [Parnassius apollo]